MTRRIPLLAALLALPVLASCQGGGGASGDAAAAGGDPEYGGTVVVGVISDVDNLLDVTSTTAAAQEMIDQLFLNLVEINPDFLTFSPDLARSWEKSEDGLSVTFHLEPEARWHDGTPVTAHDVVFTHSLHVDPAVGYSARSWKDFIVDVVAEDDHTVTYRFDRDYPYQIMDASVGAPLPRHLLEDLPRADLISSDFARNPVGNGPFRFSKWVPSQSVELVANEDFFRGRPYLDRVVFRIVPDKTNLLTQLETGAIDVMEDVPPHDVARLESSGEGIRIERFLGRSYTYIGWDSTNPLFASPVVRRALGLAIDRQGIIDALCYGYARPCVGPIHPILWAYNEDLEPLPYDPEEARRLLAAEGWTDTDGDGLLDKDGVPFAFELKTNNGNQVRMDASVMIQEQLARIGVEARPRNYEWTVLWDTVIRHTYETAVLVGWNVGLKVDLTPTFHSRSRADKYNHTGYSNPRVDELMEQALSMGRLEDTRPVWNEVQELIVADQPYTWLFILEEIYGVNNRVRGTSPDPRGYFSSLDEWWIPASRQRHRAGA